ncbi:hypothetical protein BDF20DRAFT_990515 [Mycotypha africana]|uniref:uncharacterized protein n=1 Tax=Mycotypha africana TaxID=64632 RepID=UPI002300D6F7|nr:uncharacterized protein BDF20DRAFT_990515 [Mycotypha africana]KAI8970225.1 hypothetical protein BDF20DRAFT_990515 [Mycotypha africana]
MLFYCTVHVARLRCKIPITASAWNRTKPTITTISSDRFLALSGSVRNLFHLTSWFNAVIVVAVVAAALYNASLITPMSILMTRLSSSFQRPLCRTISYQISNKVHSILDSNLDTLLFSDIQAAIRMTHNRPKK